jgi:hypothetical protein
MFTLSVTWRGFTDKITKGTLFFKRINGSGATKIEVFLSHRYINDGH